MILKKLYSDRKFSMLMSSYRIQAIADALMSVFSVVYLYEKLNLSLTYLLILFLFDSLLSAILFIPGAKIITKIGIKKSLIAGSIFFMFNYIGYLLFGVNPFIASILFLLFSVGGRVIYWTGYHVSFSIFTKGKKRGKEVSSLKNAIAIIGVVIPILASQMIEKIGFGILFIAAFFVYIASIIPLVKMEDVHQEYEFSFWETFKFMFSKKYIRNFFIGLSDGGEQGIRVVMWPIFMYLFMDSSVSSMGIMMSSVLFVTLIANTFIGKLTDKKSKASLMKMGGVLYGFGYLGKVFSLTNIQLFFFSSYQSIVQPLLRVPYESRFYEHIESKDHLIDEYTVMREISNYIGRSIILIIGIILSFYFSEQITLNIMLTIAAVCAMFMGGLSKDGINNNVVIK